MDEVTLVQRALAGEENARERLFRQLVPVIEATAYYVLRTRLGTHAGDDHVREVVQMVAVKLLGGGLEKWDPERGELKTWVRGVTRFTTMDYCRARRTRERHDGGSDALDNASGADLEAHLRTRERLEQCLKRAEADLEPSRFQQFRLLLSGGTTREVAEVTGDSHQALARFWTRMRDRFRRQDNESDTP